jgi:hypothetical protein
MMDHFLLRRETKFWKWRMDGRSQVVAGAAKQLLGSDCWQQQSRKSSKKYCRFPALHRKKDGNVPRRDYESRRILQSYQIVVGSARAAAAAAGMAYAYLLRARPTVGPRDEQNSLCIVVFRVRNAPPQLFLSFRFLARGTITNPYRTKERSSNRTRT